jgi:hypothetical protein
MCIDGFILQLPLMLALLDNLIVGLLPLEVELVHLIILAPATSAVEQPIHIELPREQPGAAIIPQH